MDFIENRRIMSLPPIDPRLSNQIRTNADFHRPDESVNNGFGINSLQQQITNGSNGDDRDEALSASTTIELSSDSDNSDEEFENGVFKNTLALHVSVVQKRTTDVRLN